MGDAEEADGGIPLKYTITYEYDPTYGLEAPFWAKTVAFGRSVCRCGSSYGDAKTRLLVELHQYTAPGPVPKAEEVEV